MNTADHFDFAALKRICEAHETEFQTMFEMDKMLVPDAPKDNDFYLFKDNGASILAVAHLDTVVSHHERTTTLHPSGVVRSGALDDRLGAYVISTLLPRMGMTFDLLFTTGEEMGRSTAEWFDPSQHHDREYNWIIEFDRGGTDVVLYQYEDADLIERVEETGVQVNPGMFSDISSLEHLGRKAINWGVGYRDYHSTRGHVYLRDLFRMVDAFVDFHERWADEVMEHEPMTWDVWDCIEDDRDDEFAALFDGWSEGR